MVVQPLGPPLVFQQEAWKQVLCLVISSACREVYKKLLDIKPIQWALPVHYYVWNADVYQIIYLFAQATKSLNVLEFSLFFYTSHPV